jgi:hypothetical protein
MKGASSTSKLYPPRPIGLWCIVFAFLGRRPNCGFCDSDQVSLKSVMAVNMPSIRSC